ncbi:hypothetical protein Hamer_G016142 [Homarus americanus]|uniref:Uncharacterized protein n=1 Tax=Homarus americanus TaxID=6706 RepID=A0A8J5N0C9_HOMAM|nr:hypothetical protein Hamer_G016142 [Homarus americanus]
MANPLTRLQDHQLSVALVPGVHGAYSCPVTASPRRRYESPQVQRDVAESSPGARVQHVPGGGAAAGAPRHHGCCLLLHHHLSMARHET